MLEKSTSVLVIDDVATMRKIVSGLLQRIGIENVETLADPVLAIQTLEQKPFDLVISDWHMEGMNALELLAQLRDHPDLRDMPFIVSSADSSAGNIADARNAGANAYLIKPFSSDALKSAVMEALELKGTGAVTYKGYMLILEKIETRFRCHILMEDCEVAALPPHNVRQGAIDDAKLWIDQLRTFG